jgi:3-oxoacyl-[acyl-carrier-protein] synthase II
VGVSIGSGVGALDEVGAAAVALAAGGRDNEGQRKISPYFVPRVLVNMAAGHVSMRWRLRGPQHAASTACATGAHAIGDAFRLIQHGDADAMVAGGSEAAVHTLAVAGFSRAKALATKYNEQPRLASRPFDARRDGFVLGEGAGVVVLEDMDTALARGAPIYAEIRGYGCSGDAHHITAPKEDGGAAYRCMSAALAEGGLAASQIDYVNAHATSTPRGDEVEARALANLFRGRPPGASRVAVSSTKGAIGHLLGAAGAVEAIFTILAIKHGAIPPTLNLSLASNASTEGSTAVDDRLPTDVCDFVGADGGGFAARPVHAALNNSFGFGGTNCSLLFNTMK